MKPLFRPFFSVLAVAIAFTTASAQDTDPLADFIRIVELREDKTKVPELVEACKKFSETHEGTSADAHVLYFLAKATHDAKKYDESNEAATALIDNHGDSPLLVKTRMLRGESHRLTEKWEDALPDFKAAFEGFAKEKHAEAPHALYHLAQSYHFTDQPDKADESYETLKTKYPGNRYIATVAKLLGKEAPAAPAAPAAAPKPKPFEKGDAAPDIKFTQLSDNAEKKLSDFKGKVVVIDFWASWCGPCQAPMAKMQTYGEKHPEWKDQVVLMALSIDKTADVAIKHLDAKGWDKTYNTWGGAGGFRAPAPTAYQVRGIPSAYVIDQDGKIAAMGHPNTLDIPEIVGGLLK
ncbi:MAG: redoxin domain-containing protein [Verrucomicrobiales bacterium]|nr:redoxin domain-containing protein [Verrucomicrobiales bacterium]